MVRENGLECMRELGADSDRSQRNQVGEKKNRMKIILGETTGIRTFRGGVKT